MRRRHIAVAHEGAERVADRSRRPQDGCASSALSSDANMKASIRPSRNRAASRPCGRAPGEAAAPGGPRAAKANMPSTAAEHAGDADPRDGGEQHFRVRRSAPGAVADALQILLQLAEVIDFAVVDDDVPPIGRGHRLVAVAAQVLDRKPAKAEGEPDRRVDQRAVVVRSAVTELARHALHDRRHLLGRAVRRRIHESRNSTHLARPRPLA